uniref:UDP-N-acetylmuramate dehydrogenase n=1 Tax=Paulinella chromatophora TaxID=39717 RepID=B1X4I7_PAUCH|nr:UDP-N-acetylenolpyruvoylglucosamine reductase [Paulinella chromatophora]ACB42856.1 UDP-N-acetylenolpyruvoylglucosamine reductase [Paulinella chromatophora]
MKLYKKNNAINQPEPFLNLLRRNVSLTEYTSWKVGGSADLFAEPELPIHMLTLTNWARREGIPMQILGAGSNVLIQDSNLEGLTLCSRRLHGSRIDKKSGWVEAQAGEPIPNLVRKVARAGLSGLEWAIGIPGTIGGAVVMNAGAHGQCTAEWLMEIVVIDLNDSKMPFIIPAKDLGFDYRQSRLQEENLVVISARFRLKPGFLPVKLLNKTKTNLSNRINSQPYKNPSCGSVFRNPETKKVAELIEALGLKGTRIGGAQISKLHSNFIVNTGGASAQDIRILIVLIQRQALILHNTYLYSEVKLVGSFSTSTP